MDHAEIVSNAMVLYLSGLADKDGEVLCDFISEIKVSVRFLDMADHYTMTFYSGQHKSQAVEFKLGQRIGIKRYHLNGQLKSDERFVEGKFRDGLYQEWYDDGKLKLTSEWYAGDKTGQETTYKSAGDIESTRDYNKRTEVQANTQTNKEGVKSNPPLKTWYWDNQINPGIKQKKVTGYNAGYVVYMFYSRVGGLIASRIFENGVKIAEWGDPGVEWEDESEMYK